jgi:hypothetical protein
MEVEDTRGTKIIRKNETRRADVLEKDADVNEDADLNKDKTTNKKDEVKVVGESSRSLSFRKRIRGLSPHRRPLKDRMRNKTVSYINLLRPGPPPSRRDNKTSRRLAKRK